MAAQFREGQSILYREVTPLGKVIDIKPVTVVEDQEDRILLWLPLGTKTKKPILATPRVPGKPRQWVEGQLVDGIWKYAEILILIRTGRRHATWIKWSEERNFIGWYINLQSELSRTEFGFNFLDHQLDIIVQPDWTWEYKDEIELKENVKWGKITPNEAEAIHLEGKKVVEEISRNQGPLFESWSDWSPPHDLPKPVPPELYSTRFFGQSIRKQRRNLSVAGNWPNGTQVRIHGLHTPPCPHGRVPKAGPFLQQLTGPAAHGAHQTCWRLSPHATALRASDCLYAFGDI